MATSLESPFVSIDGIGSRGCQVASPSVTGTGKRAFRTSHDRGDIVRRFPVIRTKRGVEDQVGMANNAQAMNIEIRRVDVLKRIKNSAALRSGAHGRPGTTY